MRSRGRPCSTCDSRKAKAGASSAASPPGSRAAWQIEARPSDQPSVSASQDSVRSACAHQRAGLVRRPAQIVGADLQQFAVRAQPAQRQRWRHARGEHALQARRAVVEQGLQALQCGGLVEPVQPVEHPRDGAWQVRRVLHQRDGDQAQGLLLARWQRRGQGARQGRMKRRAVARQFAGQPAVNRQHTGNMDLRLAGLAHPAAQQGGLARTGRPAQHDAAQRVRALHRIDQPRPGQRFVGAPGKPGGFHAGPL
jgi:hypothetical protein